MKLIPLIMGMKLYCRRMINVGGRNYLEAQELPYKHMSLSWRAILRLYEQRRVVSASDPYFQELLETHGHNNPEFTKVWLKENGVKDLEKEIVKPKRKSTRKSRVTKVKEAKARAAKKAMEVAENARNPKRMNATKAKRAAKAEARRLKKIAAKEKAESDAAAKIAEKEKAESDAAAEAVRQAEAATAE